jgi:hypothetical protein
VHIVRNEKLNETRAEEIENKILRKENYQKRKAHTEGVDDEKLLSAPSVGKRSV